MANSDKSEILIKFFQKGREHLFSKDEVIQDSSEAASNVYLLSKGFVKSYTISNDGDTNILSIYGPGYLFALGPALRKALGRNPYTMSETVYFEAITNIRVYSCPSTELLDFSDKNPQAYKELVIRLLDNYEVYISRAESYMYKHAYQRLAYQLLVFSNRFSTESYGQVVIDVPFTHQDLADCMNMARETVSRELDKLKSVGLVDVKDKHIIICDYKGLQRVLDEE